MPEDPKDQNVDPKKTDQDPPPKDAGGKDGAAEPGKKDKEPAPDPEKIRAEVKDQILSEVSQRLKKLFGVDSLDAVEEQMLKKKGEFEELYQKERERAEGWKKRFEETLLMERTRAAAAQAGAIDPDIVLGLVKELKPEVTEDGKVLVEGNPIDQVVAKILEDKPFLKQASGKEGGGAQAGQAGQGSQKEKLEQEYEEAKKKGDTLGMLRIKRQLAAIS